MRGFLVKAIPIVTLVLFILIMLSSDFLKRPMGRDDDIPGTIKGIMEDVSNERWEEAGKETERLEGAWKKVVRRIQFSAERDEINALSMNIARLKGSIMAKDKADALAELSEGHRHWVEIGN